MYLGLASILCGVVSLIASQGLLQRYTGAEELVAEVAVCSSLRVDARLH